MSYYMDSAGHRIEFSAIASAVEALCPDLRDKHIFEQLEALGLRESFNNGETPRTLPYSFSEYLR